MTQFIVISAGWNCKPYIYNWHRSIRSTPKNSSHKIIAIDDASTDGTLKTLLELQKKDNNLIVLSNKKNMGPAYSRWQAFKYIRENNFCLDDVCILIDMDDYVTLNFFNVLDSSYKENIKMTMGGIKNRNINKYYSDKEIDNNTFLLNKEYLAYAPITFRVALIDGLKKEFFYDQNGEWLEYCTDVPLCFSLLTQINSKEIFYIQRGIYTYTSRQDSTLKKFKDKKKEMLEILKKRKYEISKIDLSSESQPERFWNK